LSTLNAQKSRSDLEDMAISNQKVLLRSHAGLTITINNICDDDEDDSDYNCKEHGSQNEHCEYDDADDD
jgi:hypothetical protein